MSLLDRAVVTLLPVVPKRVVRKLSSRYIAGPGSRTRGRPWRR